MHNNEDLRQKISLFSESGVKFLHWMHVQVFIHSRMRKILVSKGFEPFCTQTYIHWFYDQTSIVEA